MSEAKENSWSRWPIICKTHSKYFYTTLANTNYISREEPPSIWEILFLIPQNIVYPFLYIMDIVKDLVQFVLLVKAVGGLSLVLEYWSSFSSTVLNISFVTLFNITFKTSHYFAFLQNRLYGVLCLQFWFQSSLLEQLQKEGAGVGYLVFY